MRILVAGATGMIGAALAERLAAEGHGVLRGVRDIAAARERWPGSEPVRIDYAQEHVAEALAGVLADIDVVVNAVGIFREKNSQSFHALHVKGPVALFEAAVAAGVGRVVQVSALGADPRADTAYLSSKGRADAALHALPIAHTVVLPSLVFAPQGLSTRWFALLAALPLTPLPGDGGQRVQPIHLDDLCEAIVRLVDSDRPPRRLQAVGAEPVTLRQYLAAFKRALRLPGAFVGMPMPLVRLAARAFATVSSGPATPEALRMLQAGSVGDVRALAELLGRSPRRVEAFIADRDRGPMRRRAQLAWLLPVLRCAVAATWIVTGLVSAFVFPTESSLALLARTGLDGPPALAALYGAAALDVALGLAVFVRRLRRPAYRMQIAVILAYTAVITFFLPGYWAHPYGPILKNIPLLAAIVLLERLEDDAWTC